MKCDSKINVQFFSIAELIVLLHTNTHNLAVIGRQSGEADAEVSQKAAPLMAAGYWLHQIPECVEICGKAPPTSLLQ